MRSRYSAYVLGDTGWLRQTWHVHVPRRSGRRSRHALAGLTVSRTRSRTHARHVAFVARYKVGGRAHRLEN
jgi:SEC-C motif-containing protein